MRCAWGAAPLPCASGSAGLIYASHVLEHVRWHDVPYALAEAHRVLVRGGALEVWVPDLAYLMAYYAAVYVKPQKRGAVDLYGELLPRPRIFAWSLWHSAFMAECLVDFDGVLCVDPTVREDDQEAYAAWLKAATPLYRPRRVAGIVTNRLERYRADTEAWLAEHGIEYGSLTMQPHATPAERRKRSDTAAYKAAVYAASDAPLFVESYDKQAERIAALSGKPCLAVPSWALYRATLTP